MQPINTAICSFGMSGVVFHAPFIHYHPGFNLHGVWERTKQLAAAKYPGVKTFRSLEELLADDAVELVIVNTPNYTHYEYTKKALEANKHVIVEKPFTNTVSEGEELIELAKQKGLKLAVFHNRRYDSDFRTVQKVVQEKLLGEIIEVEIHFDRFKEELSPKVHKEIPGPGTGVLYDLGSHLIDSALTLFGKPEGVFGDIRTVRPVSQIDDYFDVTLFYPKLRVKLKSSLLVREALPGFILHGTKGSFLKHRTDVQEVSLMAGDTPETPGYGIEPESEQGLLHTEIDGKEIREKIPTLPGNYLDYFEEVYQSIRNNKPEPVTGSQALDIIKIIEASYLSNKEKRVVSL
jgi:scyllo-inositol 2-dehydrogenase (NADP+)